MCSAWPNVLRMSKMIQVRNVPDELHRTLKVRAGELMAHLEGKGAKLYLPRDDRDYVIHVGLRMLVLRHLVEEKAGRFAAVAVERPLLAYYANAVAHLRQDQH